MGTRKIRKGIRDPERAKRVESQEVTIQSTWLGGGSHTAAFGLGDEMKSRCFRAQSGVHLQVADLWCSTAFQGLGGPCSNKVNWRGRLRA